MRCSAILGFGFSIANLRYGLDRDSEFFEYRMVIRTTDKAAMEKLAASLRTMPDVVEFRISPTGD